MGLTYAGPLKLKRSFELLSSKILKRKKEKKKENLSSEKDREKMGSSNKDQLPPYPNAARISDSQCYPQYTASLKCNNSLFLLRFYLIFLHLLGFLIYSNR